MLYSNRFIIISLPLSALITHHDIGKLISQNVPEERNQGRSNGLNASPEIHTKVINVTKVN